MIEIAPVFGPSRWAVGASKNHIHWKEWTIFRHHQLDAICCG
jgi:hypothetical protein